MGCLYAALLTIISLPNPIYDSVLFIRNLQAAVCSYYDFDQPNVGDIPSMTFVKDITIGEGESVRPGVNFLKTWRIRNSGLCHLYELNDVWNSVFAYI